MSILEVNQLDGVGLDERNDERLLLFISDHLDWKDEDSHIELLNEKLNNYYHYIMSGQYKSQWRQVSEFVICIAFQYGLSDNADKFLGVVAERLATKNIYIELME